MCGITGYTGKKVRGSLAKMARAIHHRGPDEEGVFEDERFHLAVRRLSIQDLETGSQPKFNSRRNVVVFLNGEIYNHLELRSELLSKGYRFLSRSSDTEVIAHLYDEHGIRFVEKLIGMFAICLLDRTRGELYLIRDRFGKKPIYYVYDPRKKTMLFSSEFNPLKPPKKKIDLSSLVWYFSQKSMPSLGTIDEKVRKVPPSSYLRLTKRGTIDLRTYYRIGATRRNISANEGAAAKDFEALLKDSVRLRIQADVEVGAFLSGGIDSSLIVALASKFSSRPLRTFCLTYRKNINGKFDDMMYARSVAERFGTRHTEVILTPGGLARDLPDIVRSYGQPNSACVANWFISKEMAKKLKVALSGDGADELFGSYFLHRVTPALVDYRQKRDLAVLAGLREDERSFVLRNWRKSFAGIIDGFGVFRDEEMGMLFKKGLYKKGMVTRMIGERSRQVVSRDPLNKILEYDCRNLLPDQLLNYSDVLGMAHSLEIRNPYLDHRLSEYLFSLPARYKMRDGNTKHLLKKIALRYLPKNLVCRPKEGFVEPAVYWIHKEMKGFCLSYLNARSFNKLGYLDREYVRALTRSFYRKFDFYTGKKIWTLLMYAIWEKHCVE